MTGDKFEREFCEVLKGLGYWALNIPKNKNGAQPFDVVAMHGNTVLTVDCKVCSGKPRFPLVRIEDNQWTAFKTVHDKTFAGVGIAVYYDGNIYFYQYKDLQSALKHGLKSVPIDKYHIWLSKEEIKETIGRYLE